MSIKVKTLNKRIRFSLLVANEDFVIDIGTPTTIFKKISNLVLEGKAYNAIVLYSQTCRVIPFTFFGSDYQVYKVEIVEVTIVENL